MSEYVLSRSSTARLGSRQSRNRELSAGNTDVARKRLQLPPLVHASEKSACAYLISQLEELGIPQFEQLPSNSPTNRGMKSISSLGQRANARAAEVDKSAAASDMRRKGMGGDGFGLDSGMNGGFVVQAKRNFDRIVADIDAMTNGNGGMTTLKKGDTIVETVPAGSSKYYRVPLPGRSGNLIVTLVRTSGASPGLCGSTSCEQPSSKICELRAVDDKLVYSHVVQDSAGNEDVNSADAIFCGTYLYINVEAQSSMCSYRLSVGFTPTKTRVALPRNEETNRAHPNRKCGWMVKLKEMKLQPHLREQFEDHLKMLRSLKRARNAAKLPVMQGERNGDVDGEKK